MLVLLLTSCCICVLQVFTRFVEVGRVALINYGPSTGNLCTIIDIVDQQRVSGNCVAVVFHTPEYHSYLFNVSLLGVD